MGGDDELGVQFDLLMKTANAMTSVAALVPGRLSVMRWQDAILIQILKDLCGQRAFAGPSDLPHGRQL